MTVWMDQAIHNDIYIIYKVKDYDLAFFTTLVPGPN